MEELLPKPEWKDCPNCDNSGAYGELCKDGTVDMIQCEFCYRVPESIFNQSALLDQYEAKEQARQDEAHARAEAEAQAKYEANRHRR